MMYKRYIPYLFLFFACFTLSSASSHSSGEKLEASVKIEQKQIFVQVHNAEGAVEAIVFNSDHRFRQKQIADKLVFSGVPAGTYSLIIIDDAAKTFIELLTIK